MVRAAFTYLLVSLRVPDNDLATAMAGTLACLRRC